MLTFQQPLGLVRIRDKRSRGIAERSLQPLVDEAGTAGEQIVNRIAGERVAKIGNPGQPHFARQTPCREMTTQGREGGKRRDPIVWMLAQEAQSRLIGMQRPLGPDDAREQELANQELRLGAGTAPRLL